MYNFVYHILKCLSYLPFGILYFFADLMYFIVYYIVRYRLSVVKNNIKNSFPEKTEKERQLIVKGFYRHFSNLLVESLKMMSMSDKEMLRRMNYMNYEPLIEHYQEGRSVIVYTSHFGNWEWLSSFSLLLPKDKPVYQVYKKLRDETSNKIAYIVRKRFGAVNVEMKELLRKMVALKKTNKQGVFGMISDQSPRYSSNLHFVKFLHQATSVLTGSEHLSKKFDLPAYFASIQRVRRGYYTCTFEKITTTPREMAEYEITEIYMKMLERDILRQPQFWLWSHKRWRHKLTTQHTDIEL